ncbi:tetratricopeptide repeat protein [Mangrovimonas xylaniphaga]|uniref:tetratricopeptide repeat protein n=1 Tax=Mangrovimonas xylaniphaga TaxID=1645915 RepID=UPI0006B5250D|nr:tetratricopeptide repeat protein [Mangrovimonas xylaniphaga]
MLPIQRCLPLIFLLFLTVFSCKDESYVDKKDLASASPMATFLGDEACMSCHQEAYNDWKGSHHDLAMKVADSVSVLGDFNNVEFPYKGGKATFYKKDADFYVNIPGPDDTYQDYPIKYTFGYTPLQQYIVELDKGKMQCLTIAWDSDKQQWFNLYPELELRSDEWIHWTGGGMRWNTACADCHSTDLHKNYDPVSESYNTTFKIINVSCEACHGPASNHVKFYEEGEDPIYKSKLTMTPDTAPQTLVNQCARCHSRRTQLTKDFTHDEAFLDQYLPALLTQPLYEPDGQIYDEVYVYGSFVQSKMYENGVSCRDCHNVHSLKLKEQGNALCLNCHAPSVYDTETHHFHMAGTEAAQCVNCHMTGRTYMGNDFRRDHSFRVPRPDQSLAYGTPNACNRCHEDKTPEWALNALKTLGKTKAIDAKDHPSDYLLAGYAGDKDAFHTLASNHQASELLRATALSNYGTMALTSKELEQLKAFLKDSSALVRNEAVTALTQIGDTTSIKEVAKLLTDSVRVVRITSAKYLDIYGHGTSQLDGFAGAHKEFEEFQEMNSDFSLGQVQIAEHHYFKKDVEKAIAAYQKAISFDSYNNNARNNLALLYYQNGDFENAAKYYKDILEFEPNNSYPYYMLGLLYNEMGQDEMSLKYLGEACQKEPFNLRAYYNYALKLQEAKNFKLSSQVLDKALQYDPNNTDLLYIKMIAAMNTGDLNTARAICKGLMELYPEDPRFYKLLQELEQPMGAM